MILYYMCRAIVDRRSAGCVQTPVLKHTTSHLLFWFHNQIAGFMRLVENQLILGFLFGKVRTPYR